MSSVPLFLKFLIAIYSPEEFIPTIPDSGIMVNIEMENIEKVMVESVDRVVSIQYVFVSVPV